MSQHTVSAFDKDLDQLRQLVTDMGALVTSGIDDAMNALVARHHSLAWQVVSNDRQIDELDARIEKLVVQTLALRAPMADDLREIVAAMKISSVVERIGDYAKNIAKRVPLISHIAVDEPLTLLPPMSQIAREMVKDALDAFAAQDPDKALLVIERDHMVDDFYNSIFRAVVTFMIENPKTISECAHILFVAKNLERVGDHATNAAEMVYYAATGQHPPERQRGGDFPSHKGE